MENNLKKRVMLKIYVEFFKQTVIERSEYIMLAFFAFSMLAFVSIMDVVHNMPKDDISNTFNFFVAAVKDTEWFIKAVVAYTLIWSVLHISKFVYRSVSKYRRFGFGKIRMPA